MSFLDRLRERRHIPQVPRQKFDLRFSPTTKVCLAVFEGAEDDLFYRPMLRALVSEGISSIVCSGKDQVLDLYAYAKSTGRLRKVLFFVDKDLDDYFGLVINPDVFCTETYSVENYVSTEIMLRRLLHDFVLLEVDDRLIDDVCAAYARESERFAELMLDAFAWICARRDLGDRVRFSGLASGLSSCLAIDDAGQVQGKPNWLAEFKRRCDVFGVEPNAANVALWRMILSSKNSKEWLRGKFELWFFVSFFNAVWKSLQGHTVSGNRKVRVSVIVTMVNAFSLLADKAEVLSRVEQYVAGRRVVWG